ncbi:hypothetical protein [Paraburkholderia caledonica]|uniref:Uncharacterized protein n=1 Tax=Paraburkholderia caledonica TaxID=134536 RepID=A0AB73II70_9BURK|nr:hypothetical protein [Paraburkholderia caledonica]
MRNILTADQFVVSILAALRILGSDQVREDGKLDQRFERAYEALLEREKDLKVTPNFTFFTDPLHGNSVRLRNALLAARENGLLESTPGMRPTYFLKMDEARARTYLQNSPLPQSFVQELVKALFIPQSATEN